MKTKYFEYMLIMALCISISLAFNAVSIEHSKHIEYELNKTENRQILDDILVREIEPKINRKDHTVWMDTPVRVLTRAANNDLDWHDLDLSSYTTANTKMVILLLMLKHSAVGAYMAVQKPGNTTTYFVYKKIQVANGWIEGVTLCGCDSNQVIQWKGASNNMSNLRIELLGYVEGAE